MKRYRLTIIFLFVLVFSLVSGTNVWSAEPVMSTYSCAPIFQVNAVQPNIMIILDNSGSMNKTAYGTYTADKSGVRDVPYAGAPYNGRVGKGVKSSVNDAQEVSSSVTLTGKSVILGMSGATSVTTGFRFMEIEIPQGATISSAYIQFKASSDDGTTGTYTIKGEDVDNPAVFSSSSSNISGRTTTSASVTWDSSSTPAITNWTKGNTYDTPDLKAIVQEIVDRENWESGNAMSFIITGTGTKYTYTYDNGPTTPDDTPVLYIEFEGGENVRYYGYFNPDYFYKWGTSSFVHAYKKVGYDSTNGWWNVTDLTGTAMTLTDSTIASEGLWDGNWMNWATMRRVDVLRKVLMGGKVLSRQYTGQETCEGHTPDMYDGYVRVFDSSSGSAVTPYDGTYYYQIKGGDIEVYSDSGLTTKVTTKTIKIDKDMAYDPDDFYYEVATSKYHLAGILNRVGDKARWANMWFDGSNGGEVKNTMQPGVSADLISDLQLESCSARTPLAEAFYGAVQYFKQQDPTNGLPGIPNDNENDDPFHDKDLDVDIECSKSFVILLTDGLSTADKNIPSDLQDYDEDGKDTTFYDSDGSDYLDDVALYAHTTDLRSDTVGDTPVLDGMQNLTLYTILAFEEDLNAVSLLSDAAKNGGFTEKDGTFGPSLQSEWDEDSDGSPDTFFLASDGYKLQKELLKAINDILRRAASGTAVSVLATSGEGEGTLVQAYFRPSVPSGTQDVNWVGYLQSLWVDDNGNLREDTVHDYILNTEEDNIVSYYLDPNTDETRVKVWHVSGTDPYPDTSSEAADAMLDLDEIKPLWEGGKGLALRDPDDRNIFTYIDKDDDDVVAAGEVVTFNSTNKDYISPYLGVNDDTAWGYLGAAKADRVSNLISYIRGTDINGLRTRTMEDGTVWKLGDIVNSTPVSVSKPTDNYHIIYSDSSFGTYYNTYKNRETVVYVGANDGMLHAFTAGQYNATNGKFEEVDSTSIGSELWAYVPQALLPHLKWLPDLGYSHVYYADLKPKIFDAKIDHDNDDTTADEWRTLLLLGLNLGGGDIEVTDDFDYDNTTSDTTRTFSSSYTCMDVTDPRNPTVLWERSYNGLKLTSSFPAVIKIKDKWFATFGSGPSDCATCSSSDYGYIYVVDLETGDPYEDSTGSGWLFKTADNKAFMNSPVSVDKDLNFNVDAIYYGETYLSSIWKGKLYKVAIPWVDDSGDYDDSTTDNYSDDPAGAIDSDKKWKLIPFFDATRPITSSVALSIDDYDNLWVYVGSGRYLSNSDKANTDQQYMFGMKDPFFNKNYQTSPTDYYHNYSNYKTLAFSDLLYSDPYIIKEGGEVLEDTSSPLDGVPDADYGGWSDLLTAARAKDGWYRTLTISGERIITRFSILGGIVFTPSFVPTTDICGFGGDSYLYGQYYETGTAYYKSVFKEGEKDITYDSEIITTILDKTSIGAGMASSIGIHVGREGSKGFIQTSTGTIIEESLETAFTVKSGLKSWIEE